MSLSAGNFIEKSILGALSFLKESLFADELASQPGFLQSLDPRMKTVTFLLFLGLVLFAHHVLSLVFLYALCLLLARFSKVRIGFFLKRTWIFIPLFSFLIAFPALFSVFSPGIALVTFYIAGMKCTITQQGLSGATLFLMRVLTSLSWVVLLSITTKHFALLKVLRTFRVSQIFVMTIGMCYRYVYLLVGIIENTYRAVKSRVGFGVGRKQGQQLAAWNMAALWMRSYQLNGDVYNAMLSRGYQGEPVLLNEFKLTIRDWLWFFNVVLASTIFFYGEHILKS